MPTTSDQIDKVSPLLAKPVVKMDIRVSREATKHLSLVTSVRNDFILLCAFIYHLPFIERGTWFQYAINYDGRNALNFK